jgi:hypothetical protein
MDSFGDTSNTRESYGAYLERTTVVDPEKEESMATHKREATLQLAARGAFRGHVKDVRARASLVAAGSTSTEGFSILPPALEMELEKRMATEAASRRARLPAPLQPSLPSFSQESVSPGKGPSSALVASDPAVLAEATRRASTAALSPEGQIVLADAAHLPRHSARSRQPGALSPAARRMLAGIPQSQQSSMQLSNASATESSVLSLARGPPKKRIAAQKTVLPRLVGDPSLPDSPLDELRAKRWKELRFLHRLMLQQGRSVDSLAEAFGTEEHMRRSHFTVIMTGFLGLDGWAMAPHFEALYDGFDISSRGSIDPRDLVCCLNLLEKPGDDVVSAVVFGFSFYARKRDGPEGDATITRDQMLALMFLPCMTIVEEDTLRGTILELTKEFERFTGDPLPARVSNPNLRRAVYYAQRYRDEFRRIWMRRLPDDVRLHIMRRAAEKASLTVQAHEMALSTHKGAVFLRDKIGPRIRQAAFEAWAEYTRHAVVLREIERRAEAFFFRFNCIRAIRRWKRVAALPRKRLLALALGKPRFIGRCFRRWKQRWWPYHVLKTHKKRKEDEEFQRLIATAMAWKHRRDTRLNHDLMRAGMWALRQEYRRCMRVRSAQDFRRKRLQLNPFSAWRNWVRQTVDDRKQREAVQARLEAEARDRIQELLRAQKEAEQRAADDAERKAREAKQYEELMRRQRRRAAVIAAFNEATKSMAMRRAFRRRKAFHKITRRGLKLWDDERPQKLEEKRQELWTWLHESDQGRAELADMSKYIQASVEAVTVPAHMRGKSDNPAEAAAASEAFESPRPGTSASRRTADAASASIGVEAVHFKAETLGTRDREPWQLRFRYQELVREWTNVKTGESVGPKRNKFGLPKMTDVLARRIAVENFLAIREPYLLATIDSGYEGFAEAATKHGHAYIIQDFFRTYRRVMLWKWLKNEAVKAKKAATQLERAKRRKAAIVTIQCAWRCRSARRELLWRLLGAWSVCISLEDNAVYYTSSMTGESRWEPPDLLVHMAHWNWHFDRERRLSKMSASAREEYWDSSLYGGRDELMARDALIEFAEKKFQVQLRKGLAIMQGTADTAAASKASLKANAKGFAARTLASTLAKAEEAAGEEELVDPTIALRLRSRAGPPPTAMLRYEAFTGMAGKAFVCENGEVTASQPYGYILCEECSAAFAATYVAEEDRLYCPGCFLSTHNKLKRADAVGYVVAPGPYLNGFQAPSHVNRSAEMLFGAVFARHVLASEHRRRNPKTQTFYVLG